MIFLDIECITQAHTDIMITKLPEPIVNSRFSHYHPLVLLKVKLADPRLRGTHSHPTCRSVNDRGGLGHSPSAATKICLFGAQFHSNLDSLFPHSMYTPCLAHVSMHSRRECLLQKCTLLYTSTSLPLSPILSLWNKQLPHHLANAAAFTCSASACACSVSRCSQGSQVFLSSP